MNKDEIAALLESLCERPFAGERPIAGDAHERPAAMDVSAGRSAPSSGAAEPSGSVGSAADDPGPAADLAAILSGTATDAQCQAFQEAAMRSSAVRLEAQSALAFLNGIDAAPLAAPAHLVAQVVAAAGDAPARAQPGLWSSLSGHLLGRRAGQVAAACVVTLMAGGLSWSLWRADLSGDGVAIPTATSPKAGAPVVDIEPRPAAPPAPAVSPAPSVSPMPLASPEQSSLPGRSASPLLAPPLAPAPAPELAPSPPPVQALADPCGPRGFATSEARTRSKVEPKAAKPAPSQPQSKTATVSAPDPGCGVDAGAVEAVQGPVRAAKPAANIGRLDRAAPPAAASAPAAGYPPAAPATHPSANAPPR